MPVRVFPLQDWLEGLNTGIGEKDVEPTESGVRRLGRSTQSGEIALVKTRFASARASGFDQTAGLRQFVARRGCDLKRRTDWSGNVNAHYVGAPAGKGDRSCAPDSGGGSGDDGGLPSQTLPIKSSTCPPVP